MSSAVEEPGGQHALTGHEGLERTLTSEITGQQPTGTRLKLSGLGGLSSTVADAWRNQQIQRGDVLLLRVEVLCTGVGVEDVYSKGEIVGADRVHNARVGDVHTVPSGSHEQMLLEREMRRVWDEHQAKAPNTEAELTEEGKVPAATLRKGDRIRMSPTAPIVTVDGIDIDEHVIYIETSDGGMLEAGHDEFYEVVPS